MSKEDSEGICILMDSGFSFKDALDLLKDSHNQKCVNTITEKLETGVRIETFVETIFPKHYMKYLKPFCQFLPFSKSLQLTVTCIKEERSYRVNTLKELVYPLLLFMGTWLGLVVFTLVCFPTLISLFKSFDMSLGSIMLIQTIFNGLSIALTLLMFLAFVLVMCWFNKKYKVKFYEVLCKCFKSNFAKTYQSSLFARFYLQCAQNGSKTKEILQLLQSIDSQRIINLISKTVEEALLNGEKMEIALGNNYLDRTLIQYMKLAIYSSTMDSMLEGYIKINEERMKKTIKRFSKGCQFASYLCIGFIIIVVYQILILPLTLMSKL